MITTKTNDLEKFYFSESPATEVPRKRLHSLFTRKISLVFKGLETIIFFTYQKNSSAFLKVRYRGLAFENDDYAVKDRIG